MASDLITDDGLNEILNRLLGLVGNPTLYIAVGSGNTAPVGTESALETETGRAIASSSVVSANQATVKAFFNTSQANGSLGESGLVTAGAAGVLVDKGIETPPQTKVSTQELLVEKVITLTRG